MIALALPKIVPEGLSIVATFLIVLFDALFPFAQDPENAHTICQQALHLWKTCIEELNDQLTEPLPSHRHGNRYRALKGDYASPDKRLMRTF